MTLSLFQIIMVAIMGTAFLFAVGFAIAFIVQACKDGKMAKQEKVEQPQTTEETDEDYDIRQMLAQLEAENQEEVVETPAEEQTEEPAEKQTEEATEEVSEEEQPTEVANAVEEEVEQTAEEATETEGNEGKTIIIKEVTTETVGTDFDYNVRLAKVVESKNKMEKDLQKTKRAIMKYERTQRRRARNQKMLDRRAVELTNLNLNMYSVTDIKNIDEDKKARQEELTKHIAELKASIQDADEFLEKNREKYEHDKKMYAFYQKEEARYNDEIKELEVLIANAGSVTGSTTTTTTTTTNQDGEVIDQVVETTGGEEGEGEGETEPATETEGEGEGETEPAAEGEGEEE